MAEKVIPLADHRYAAALPRDPARACAAPTGLLADTLGRPLRDLRISVTDRCNFRCSYCMPKEVFDKHYAFLPHASLLSFEEITRAGAAVRRARRAARSASPAASRCCARTSRCWSSMLAELRTPDGAAARPDADHQRLAAGAQGAGAEGRRPAARHREPRRARRRDLPPHERRRLPGRRRAARHRRGASASGLGPIKVNMVVKRGTNDARDPADGAPLPRHAAWCCASSSTWTSARPTAGAWTRCCRRPRCVARHRTPSSPLRAARRQRAGRDRRALALRRRRRRDRRHLQRHAGLLPRLQPRAPVDRRQALPVPVREPAATTCARCCAAAHSDDADRRGDRPDLAAARRPLLRAAQRARRPTPAAASGASRCTTSADEPRPPLIRPLGAADLADYKRAARRRCSRCIPRRSPPTPRATPRRSPPTTCTGSASSGATAASSSLGAWRARRLRRCDRLRARGAPQGAPHRPRHRHDGAARGARPRASARCCSRPASPRRATPGLEMLTLTVTAENAAAIRLYERARLRRLRHAAARAQGRRPLPRQAAHGAALCSDAAPRDARALAQTSASRQRVARRFQVSTTVSGFSEIDAMPSSASQSAKSGWSLGPWPQMPTYLPAARQAAIAREISALTAGRVRRSRAPAAPARNRGRGRA